LQTGKARAVPPHFFPERKELPLNVQAPYKPSQSTHHLIIISYLKNSICLSPSLEDFP
jgi:hypothetical protein